MGETYCAKSYNIRNLKLSTTLRGLESVRQALTRFPVESVKVRATKTHFLLGEAFGKTLIKFNVSEMKSRKIES